MLVARSFVHLLVILSVGTMAPLVLSSAPAAAPPEGRYECFIGHRAAGSPKPLVERRGYLTMSGNNYQMEGNWGVQTSAGQFTYDAASSAVHWQSGTLATLFSATGSSNYSISKSGLPTITGAERIRGAVYLTVCALRSAVQRQGDAGTPAASPIPADAGIPPSPTPTSPPVLPPARGEGGLSGLYWQSYTSWGMGAGGGMYATVQTRILYFLPDGHYRDGTVEGGFDHLVCGQLDQRGNPVCGTYSLAGNTLVLSSGPGKKTTSLTVKKDRNDRIRLDGYYYQPPSRNLRLDGYYRYTFGGGRIGMGQRGITFHGDGRFVETSSAAVISPVPQARGGSHETTGTYSIEDYTLELHYADGTVKRRSFWQNTKTSAYIDGVLYSMPG